MKFLKGRKKAEAFLKTVDPEFGALVRKVGPLKMAVAEQPSVFHAFVRSVTHQQLAGAAARAIFERVQALFSTQQELFPEPVSKCRIDRLRGAGLSRTKAKTIKELGRTFSKGQVPDEKVLMTLPNEKVVEIFSQIRGIGPWTVEMILMFQMGREDILPTTDYGVRKGYSIAYGKRKLPTPGELKKKGEAWAPYRTAASWYLWRANDL